MRQREVAAAGGRQCGEKEPKLLPGLNAQGLVNGRYLVPDVHFVQVSIE